MDCDVVRLTRNAPAATAGHSRTPPRSSAARAIPAAGHTGDVLAWTDASNSPARPAR